MCGILFESGSDLNDELFSKNLDLISHRGPDHKSFVKIKNKLFGHVRLSIIDLSSDGNQPMFSSCGNYLIIFNGEIYNFIKIKNKLLDLGYKFKTKTDTEVILNGFIHYKEEITSMLSGMFSFCIYDLNDDSVFIARDRSGIKPLYYYHQNDKMIISSEARVFKTRKFSINHESKILFMLLGSIPEPATIYKDVYSFPSGNHAFFKNNKLSFSKFSKYSFSPKLNLKIDHIKKEIQTKFKKAVSSHLISDAPVGVFLSGGVDSSLITAIASEEKKIDTVSLVFDNEKFSEKYYQNIVAKKFNTNHHEFLINDKIFAKNLDAFIKSVDQPTVDGLNTYLVSKFSKNIGLKCVLSGLGADEIFHGYSTFDNAKKLSLISNLPKKIIQLIGLFKKYEKHGDLLQVENELKLYLPTRALFSPKEISKHLNISLSEVFNTIINFTKQYSYNEANIDINDLISHMELEYYMKNQLLKDSDVFGMANSIEIRVPFLDYDFLNFSTKIHSKYKSHKRINKKLLIDSFGDLIPNEIYERNKMGFTMPFKKWFESNNSEIRGLFKNYDPRLPWFKNWAFLMLQKFND